MSRTDKDTPHHVTATWWLPWHVRCENSHTCDSIGTDTHLDRDCDLPADPDPRLYHDTNHSRCHWYPAWERHHYPNPPHWYINHVWTARERLAARVDCLNAAKEHRASSEVDTVASIRQNRHCAQWLWS